VSGHTSSHEASTKEGNLALGLAMASKVVAELVNAGVPLGKMSVQSFGEARPMTFCDGNPCEDVQNRRVEIFLW